MFDRTFVVFVVFACVLVALMTCGLYFGMSAPLPSDPVDAEKVERGRRMARVLVVLLFFSATIVNLGVRWAGKILAGRRFKKVDPRRSARAFTTTQLVCFGSYAAFFAAVLYYRLAYSGEKGPLVVATAAAVLGSFYFMRVPAYLLSIVFAPDEEAADRPL
jgi:hypothetical protein